MSACIGISLVIAGCGGGGSSPDTAADEAFRIESAGRLAVIAFEMAGVHIIDLDSAQKISTVATTNPPSALYASPDRRYALAISVANGWTPNREIAVTGAVSEDRPAPSLDAHPSASNVFMMDPEGKRILVVETKASAIIQEISLDFEPGIVRWLGIAESHDH